MGVSASGPAESGYLLLVGQNVSALGALMQQLLPDTAKSVSNLSEEFPSVGYSTAECGLCDPMTLRLSPT